MKGKMYLWRGSCINEGEDVFMKGKMYLWRKDVFMKGKMYLWSEDVFMKGKMYLWREDVFVKKKMYSHRRHIQIPGIFERKIKRNVWESVLAKNPGFFEPFATARFYNSKGKRRCADCRFVADAVHAQISIKKSWIFLKNGKGKPPVVKGKVYLWSEDVFMKGKTYLWSGRCIYEGKMYLWKGRCIHEAKMCLWRGRCIYEGEDVFMKGRCIYEGRKKILEFLKKLKIRCFSKTKEIPGISHRRHIQIPGIFERKIRT